MPPRLTIVRSLSAWNGGAALSSAESRERSRAGHRRGVARVGATLLVEHPDQDWVLHFPWGSVRLDPDLDTPPTPVRMSMLALQAKVNPEPQASGQAPLPSPAAPKPSEVPTCVLCMEAARDPLTTACGHTFCSGKGGECEGLRKMAQLTNPQRATVSCPHCRKDILPLLARHFTAELQLDQVHNSSDDSDSDDGDVSPETFRRYQEMMTARRRPPPPISGVVGDLLWQQAVDPSERQQTPRRLGTWPGDRYAFHRQSGEDTLGFFNLASRVRERFHPQRGEWRALLQPGGVYFDAALVVCRHHRPTIRGPVVAQLREWEWIPGPASRVHPRDRQRTIYSFLLEHVLHERTPAICFVGQVLRQDAMHFIYNAEQDRLVYSHSDSAQYTGRLLPALHQHAHGPPQPPWCSGCGTRHW